MSLLILFIIQIIILLSIVDSLQYWSNRAIMNSNRKDLTKLSMARNSKFELSFRGDDEGEVDKEEELQRLAFNAAFDQFGLQLPDGSPVEWDAESFHLLKSIFGGSGRRILRHYFDEEVKSWPASTNFYVPMPRNKPDQDQLVGLLNQAKEDIYAHMLEEMEKSRATISIVDVTDNLNTVPEVSKSTDEIAEATIIDAVEILQRGTVEEKPEIVEEPVPKKVVGWSPHCLLLPLV